MDEQFIFRPFPSIPRWSRDISITEKINGTNAKVSIVETEAKNSLMARYILATFPNGKTKTLHVLAGSKERWLVPGSEVTDNYGFAAWVKKNAEELLQLGPGHHAGEWWGQGIYSGYGLKEQRFSLFNLKRWGNHEQPSCCHVVPELYHGPNEPGVVERVLRELAEQGSRAAPGFMHPEGVVIFHTASGHMYKKTIKDDESPKSLVRNRK